MNLDNDVVSTVNKAIFGRGLANPPNPQKIPNFKPPSSTTNMP